MRRSLNWRLLASRCRAKAPSPASSFVYAAASGVGAAVTQFTGTVDALDRRVRDAVVEGVDHPANGVAAVKQGGRATDDFDALDGYRVQRHGMIVGQRRGIQGTDAIAQDTNAVAIQAADHRAAGARAEPGRGDTGLLVKGFTQAAVLLLQQVVAFEHGAGGGQLAVTQRVGGDDLRLKFYGLAGDAASQSATARGKGEAVCTAWGWGVPWQMLLVLQHNITIPSQRFCL